MVSTALPTFLMAWILRVPLTFPIVAVMLAAGLLACFLGAGFGIAAMSIFSNQRAAQQVFPFLMFPQFFLAGIFNPIKVLPWYLTPFSLISPMRYPVDLFRGLLYAGQPDYAKTVLLPPLTNLTVMLAMFAVFLVLGTALFVRQETNR